MAIKVYGSMFSTATIRVLLCLTEKDLDFELINIDLASGEHQMPHMLSRNPFGQIPAFEDGDVKLFESRAIILYIVRTYPYKGTNLVSHDPKQKAIETMWMEVECQVFDPAVVGLAWELWMKRFLFGQKEDPAIGLEKKLDCLLDVYESRLSESKYLAGDRYSLADLYHVPMIKFLMDTQTKEVFEAREHLSAWVRDILARRACLKAYCYTGEDAAAATALTHGAHTAVATAVMATISDEIRVTLAPARPSALPGDPPNSGDAPTASTLRRSARIVGARPDTTVPPQGGSTHPPQSPAFGPISDA
ncbi:LOW QUALITY PROTEIN: hypothetical protein OSB04_020235 [Centaurea solstitialis]|uniref:glutathione transferase n=1 Tax=Centaurea solstitialis TaxID=347529 RepID=A0AA38TA97_9ASTR|nr:LOW QUALITY PROTEIN: hypothetical protein OSB04_020235 [Centaurea solstitialis]